MIAAFAGIAPAQDARQAIADGQRLLEEPARRPQAQALFEQVLAGRQRWFHPLAHIGLATLHRLRGQPMPGLDELARAQVALDALPDQTHALALLSRRQLHEERFRCFLSHGLLDLAEAEYATFAQLGDKGDAVERYAVAIAEVDLRCALGSWSAAQRALEQAERRLPPDRPDAVADLEVRRAHVAQHVAQDPEAHGAAARRLEQLLDERRIGGSRRVRAGLDAVEAWLDAGDVERARARSLLLQAEPAESHQRDAEILAQFTRVQIEGGAATVQLAELQVRLAAAVAALFADWRGMPLRDGGAGSFWFHDRRDVLGALLALDRRVLPAEQALAAAHGHLSTALALGTLSRRCGAAPPSLLDLQARIAPRNGGVLLYAIAPHFVHLLLADATGAELVEIPVDAALDQLLAGIASAAATAPSNRGDAAAETAALRATAVRLADRLFPTAVRERLARWRSLLLVGDEQLVTMFQALPWREGWLATEFAVRHVPSTALAWWLEQRAAARKAATGSAIAVLGDPTMDQATRERWGVEPLALREPQRTALLGGSTRALTLWGAEATAANLGDDRTAAASALCVVTHGVQDYARERSAGLVLAPGPAGESVLFVDQVERLRVPPFVVLGVCGASAGPLRIGDDGVHHLGGAFLTAGADAVVLSGSDLPLGATIDLLGDLLARWRSGTPAAEALRGARAAVAARPKLSHPYYFTGLRLLGADAAGR